jgi:hypothetical protein
MDHTIESRIRRLRRGLKLLVVAMILMIFIAIDPISRDYMPRRFVVFALLGDLYAVCVVLWLIRRLKNQLVTAGLSEG